jgi:ATP/maltotriose-dependent transcriptional regulator MalT
VRSFRANVAENQGDIETVRAEAEASLAALREIGERWGSANALQTLAGLHTLDGDLDGAAAGYSEAIALMSELGGGEDEIVMRLRLADVRARQGDLVTARYEVNEALAASERSGSMVESVYISLVMAQISRQFGDVNEAWAIRDRALERIQRMPMNHPMHGHGLAVGLAIAAILDLDQGNIAAAKEHLRTAYETALGTNDFPVVAAVGTAVAGYVEFTGDPEEAAVILGSAARLRGGDDRTQLDIKRLTERLCELLGQQGFSAGYAIGRALDRDAAMARLDPAATDH